MFVSMSFVASACGDAGMARPLPGDLRVDACAQQIGDVGMPQPWKATLFAAAQRQRRANSLVKFLGFTGTASSVTGRDC
jgi:hypothetical protein